MKPCTIEAFKKGPKRNENLFEALCALTGVDLIVLMYLVVLNFYIAYRGFYAATPSPGGLRRPFRQIISIEDYRNGGQDSKKLNFGAGS